MQLHSLMNAKYLSSFVWLHVLLEMCLDPIYCANDTQDIIQIIKVLLILCVSLIIVALGFAHLTEDPSTFPIGLLHQAEDGEVPIV